MTKGRQVNWTSLQRSRCRSELRTENCRHKSCPPTRPRKQTSEALKLLRKETKVNLPCWNEDNWHRNARTKDSTARAQQTYRSDFQSCKQRNWLYLMPNGTLKGIIILSFQSSLDCQKARRSRDEGRAKFTTDTGTYSKSWSIAGMEDKGAKCWLFLVLLIARQEPMLEMPENCWSKSLRRLSW